MHAASWIWPVAVNAIALSYDSINPVVTYRGTCWVVDYPSGCSYYANDLGTTCIRGGPEVKLLMYVFGFLVVFVCFAVIAVSFTLHAHVLCRSMRGYE